MDFDRAVGQVDDPVFRQACERIERALDVAVVAQGGIGDFDDQKHILGAGQAGPVAIRARS